MKKIHVIITAEATHDAAAKTAGPAAYGYHANVDAPLTPAGREQARLFASKPLVDVVVCSTLTRSLQTAEILFGKQINWPPQIVATDLARERNIRGHICNYRSGLTTLRGQWLYPITGERDADPFPEQTPEDDRQAKDRAERLVSYIMSMDADRVAIVTHPTFAGSLMHVLNPEGHRYYHIDDEHTAFLPPCSIYTFSVPTEEEDD